MSGANRPCLAQYESHCGARPSTGPHFFFPSDPMTTQSPKEIAALHAADLVQDGMVLGLGTGSTAAFLVHELGRRCRDKGLQISGVCTSSATEKIARIYPIKLLPLHANHPIDLCIDGADEIDPAGRMIKGGGGALLREKLVAAHAASILIIADSTKAVAQLGRFPLPVEIVRFGDTVTRARIERALGCVARPRLSTDGELFVTDEGNHILDCHFADGRLPSPPEGVADRLAAMPGVVESGLFINLCDQAILADPDGVQIHHFQRTTR